MLPLRPFHDSGPPEGSADYTTVVIIHGFGWHSGIFKKLLPFAKQSNARFVFVNRRDYPGSEPYSPAELAVLARLATAPKSEEADAEMQEWLRNRAREVHDFLGDFVRRERIPSPQGQTGGLVIVGWSFGSSWITSLLANVGLFPEGDLKLSEYVRRVVMYDGSYILYGYPPPPDFYEPLFDTTLTEAERIERFSVWVTGHYAHGDVFTRGASALEFRTALADPPPTLTRISPDDIVELTHVPPQEAGGSDALLAEVCLAHQPYGALKDAAFYLRSGGPVEGASDWAGVEVRHVWCDRSIWEMPWGVKFIVEELEEARRAGKPIRDLQVVRFKGANHFAHWEMPEKTIRALLGDEAEIE
ncbi:Alpha/Beta hydrolase protein [Trametes meyenii]|nr:Alpha/Beta hydrolase protein [Trametes meyenii]